MLYFIGGFYFLQIRVNFQGISDFSGGFLRFEIAGFLVCELLFWLNRESRQSTIFCAKCSKIVC